VFDKKDLAWGNKGGIKTTASLPDFLPLEWDMEERSCSRFVTTRYLQFSYGAQLALSTEHFEMALHES